MADKTAAVGLGPEWRDQLILPHGAAVEGRLPVSMDTGVPLIELEE